MTRAGLYVMYSTLEGCSMTRAGLYVMYSALEGCSMARAWGSV